MTIIYCAYTEKVNPSGTSPILTRDQIWKGLQRKVRHAEEFVPPITSCEVIEEHDNVVIREAQFQAMGDQPAQKVKEVCKSYYPTRGDFWQPDGAVITNTLSDGDGFTENDYHMTYTFEHRRPNVQEGSEEEAKLRKELTAMAKMAVHSSIEAIRAMAKEGKFD